MMYVYIYDIFIYGHAIMYDSTCCRALLTPYGAHLAKYRPLMTHNMPLLTHCRALLNHYRADSTHHTVIWTLYGAFWTHNRALLTHYRARSANHVAHTNGSYEWRQARQGVLALHKTLHDALQNTARH